jgi:hypothetical protein
MDSIKRIQFSTNGVSLWKINVFLNKKGITPLSDAFFCFFHNKSNYEVAARTFVDLTKRNQLKITKTGFLSLIKS